MCLINRHIVLLLYYNIQETPACTIAGRDFWFMRLINLHYETSMALVTFSFGSVFGMVMVKMPSSTLAEI